MKFFAIAAVLCIFLAAELKADEDANLQQDEDQNEEVIESDMARMGGRANIVIGNAKEPGTKLLKTLNVRVAPKDHAVSEIVNYTVEKGNVYYLRIKINNQHAQFKGVSVAINANMLKKPQKSIRLTLKNKENRGISADILVYGK